VSGLRARATALVELMDDPACDPVKLDATYRQFRVVNRIVSGWRGLYRARIRPLLSPETGFRLLDIGSGGGDIARALADWARIDGMRVHVVAADPDPRAHAFATRAPHPGVEFRRASAAELADAGERFDLVVSNHVLHHLDDLAGFLAECAPLAPRMLHGDIRRSRIALALYTAATLPVAGRSFLYVDGRRSIRRSYTLDELRHAAPPGWQAEAVRPFRLVLSRGFEGEAAR
jgi:2-polyprenyl-3-methyl-5-hydroxy-6-metoxy-1,4-benzoquinol methylase